MNQVIYKVSLDMNKQSCNTPIYVKCGEAKTRKLIISLYNGTKPYVLSVGSTAKFRAIKADDTILFTDCTVSGNTIQYVMPDTMLSAEGVVRCEVVLYGTNSDVLYTPMFQVIVSETLDLDGLIESTSDFSALSTAMTSITTLENNVETAEAGRVTAENERVAAEVQRDSFYDQVYTDFGIGFRGTTFTPAVSTDGDISWTNDGSKPNPATVNIKGPQGAQGEPGEPGTVPVVQITGQSTTDVMSQKAVSDELADKVATVNNTAPDSNGNVNTPQIESGSNADGRYIKFPDGTMQCWKTVTINTTIQTQLGSIYITSQIYDLGSFPVTFVEIPHIFLSCDCPDSGASAAPFYAGNTLSASSIGSTYLQRPSVSSVSHPYNVRIFAVGRWKA